MFFQVSELGQDDSLLLLIFAFAIGVADFAGLVGLKEEDLAEAFVGVDPGRRRNQERHVRQR